MNDRSEPVHESGSTNTRLEHLREIGADRFDPVRFYYLQRLISRSENQRESVKSMIENRIEQAISDYLSDFNQTKDITEKLIDDMSVESPETMKQLHDLFDRCEFEAVKRVKDQLSLNKKTDTAIASLTQQISDTARNAEKNNLPLDDFLQLHVEQLTLSLQEHSTDTRQTHNNHQTELKSTRLLRKSRQKISSDKLVSQAIEEGPEAPGPLNPKMLATRSLATMRELSPQYLNRFVAYINTLLWLDTVDEKNKSASNKKDSKEIKRRKSKNL